MRNSLGKGKSSWVIGGASIGVALGIAAGAYVWLRLEKDDPIKATNAGFNCLESPDDQCIRKLLDPIELSHHHLTEDQAVSLIQGYVMPHLDTGQWIGKAETTVYPEMGRIVSSRGLRIDQTEIKVTLTASPSNDGPVFLGTVRQLMYAVWLAKYGDSPLGSANIQGITREAKTLEKFGLMGLPGIGTDQFWTWDDWQTYLQKKSRDAAPVP